MQAQTQRSISKLVKLALTAAVLGPRRGPRTSPKANSGRRTWAAPAASPNDCNRTGLHLAQVDLASIKAFMDDAYLAFVENERSGNFSLAQERHAAYVTAKTDLDLKRWRCFNCPGEIGCNQASGFTVPAADRVGSPAQ